MATINFAHREITAKVVYIGPPDAGSTTNVRKLFQLLPTDERSRLHEFGPDSESEMSLYFDYVPAGGGTISGFSLRVRVYALPGGLHHPDHVQEVIKAPDAIVFVADARPARSEDNVASLIHLERLLNDQGLDIAALPTVIQVNHADATDARSADRVAVDLNPYGFAVMTAVAAHATGVLETHDTLMRATIARLEARISGNETALPLTAVNRETRERDDDVIVRHIQAIEDAERRRHASEREAAAARSPEYDHLPEGPEIEIPFQTAEFAGMMPVQVLACAIDGSSVRLELVLSRVSGEAPRKFRMKLLSRPVEEEAMRVSTSSAVTDPPPTVTPILPHDFEWSPPEPADMPPLTYGMIGVLGGAVAGMLLGFLLFA